VSLTHFCSRYSDAVQGVFDCIGIMTQLPSGAAMWNYLTRSLTLCALIVFLANAAFSAEPTEKRIALVLGNAAYQAAPLQTAANDAGLIAQTLQAAAFDVIGARDLDQEGLRRAFRDFLEKASASGPETVAVIYLSGYALQLEGENYFLPVDAKLARDTDVIAEGVRLSDYLRPLAALHLKASIVVVDGARKVPFAVSGQPLASGLALIEPPAGTLVAFNATPGTVAPEQSGPYGTYAQALAEMMREGGLPPSDLFDRVRLRVSDVSKGAQLPWSASKLATSFAFFERSPDAPAQVSKQNVPTRRLAELSAPDAYASAVERDDLNGYEEFLSVYGGDPLAERVRAIVAVRREALTWTHTCAVDTREAYWSYLRRYPHGPHSGDARRRLVLLSAALEPPSSFALVDYDVPPPPPEEFAYVDRPDIVFADFGFVPPPPLPVDFLPPPPADFLVLDAPIIVTEPYVLPVPVFVPLPTWCHVPRYAVHPHEDFFVTHGHDGFIADRATKSFAIRTHAGQAGVTAPVTHGAALAASLPPSVRTHARGASAITTENATHGVAPTVRQPLPGMAGHPLPALPGRLGRPLGHSEGSAMAAVPPAGMRGHPQTATQGSPRLPSTMPLTSPGRGLPGTSHALPQLPPGHGLTPPTQTHHAAPPQIPRAPAPVIANRPPPAPVLRPASPPLATLTPPRAPTAALTPPRAPVQSAPPPRPMIHAAPPPPRPAIMAPPRPAVHAAPPPPRPAPPPGAAPRPVIQAAPRPAPPPAPRPVIQAAPRPAPVQAVRPPPAAAARPAQPPKRG
jgi:uncharacterized caspase-like protein